MEGVSTFDVYVLQPVTDVDVHHISKHREKAVVAVVVAPSHPSMGGCWPRVSSPSIHWSGQTSMADLEQTKKQVGGESKFKNGVL